MNNDKPSTQASPYLAYYGMTREPFAPLIEDDLFYPEPTRKQRLEILLHLTQYGNEIMQVSGPQGSGKTTLLRQLRQHAPDNWQLACIEAENGLDERQFLQQLFHQLKLDFQAASRNDLHEKLQHHFESLQHSARQAVIMIDNAEQLHIITLKNILALAAHPHASNKPALRVIFFGTNELKALFNEPQLGHLANLPQRTFDLPPFDNEQTTHYVLHRLSAANFSASKPFTDAVLSKIHKQSQGWPGRINQLAHEVLISSLPARPDKTESRLAVSRPLRSIAMVVMIAAIIVLLVLQDQINAWLDSGKKQQDAPRAVTEKLPIPEIKGELAPTSTDTERTSLPDSMPGTKQQLAGISEPLIMETESGLKDSTTNEGGVSQTGTGPLSTASQDIPSGQEPVFNPVALPQAKEIPEPEMPTVTGTADLAVASADTTSGSAATDSVDTDSPAIQLPLTTTPASVSTEPETPAANLKKPQVVNPTPKTKPEPVASTPPQDTTITAPTDPSLDLPSRQNDWLLTQDPTHFTLQLVAGNNIETIRRFIREHRLKANLALYQTTRLDKPWFGLVYGIYPNKQAAIDARGRLPEPLRRLKPWARDLGGIQKALPKSTK